MSDSAVVVSELESAKEKKTAFIVTPIGGDNSGVRRATDGLIKSVLEPVLIKYGYVSKASHQENDLGSITVKIIKHLLEDDLVIVNLSHLNANVMYELGIRHATGKPVILISDSETDLPFDTKDQRTIFYSNDMMGGIELANRLEAIIGDDNKLKNNEGNPIFMAAHESVVNRAIMEKVNNSGVRPEEKNLVELVLSKMEKFEKNLSNSSTIHLKNENNYSAILFSFIQYVKNTIGKCGIIRHNGKFYVGICDDFLSGILKKELDDKGFYVEKAFAENGVKIYVIKDDGSNREYKLKSIVDDMVIPF